MLIVIDNDFNRSNYRSLIGRTYFHIPPAYAQVCELEYTPEQLAAAREWLADLTFADVDPDEFASMPADKVIDGVARKYAGGWYEFVKSCEPMPQFSVRDLDVIESLKITADECGGKCVLDQYAASFILSLLPENSLVMRAHAKQFDV